MFRKHVKCSECGFLSVVGAEDMFPFAEGDVFKQLQIVKDLNLIGFQELRQAGREEIVNGTLSPNLLACARNIWSKYALRNQPRSDALRFLSSERRCPYFFSYNPSYLPIEHRELQRERDQRRFLIFVSLLSAAVGAGIATLANLVWSQLTS